MRSNAPSFEADWPKNQICTRGRVADAIKRADYIKTWIICTRLVESDEKFQNIYVTLTNFV